MGILSPTASLTRYIVKGKLEKPILESIYNGLVKNSIKEIDNHSAEQIVGWTSFENPYLPDFEGSSFVIGSHLIFALRVDKKSIPPKVIKKHYNLDMSKRLKETGHEYLSRNEKKEIKEYVTNQLSLRIPATPNIYDITWNYEDGTLWFFSNLKSANEELETLFKKSFKLSLIRIFPFTSADLLSGLSDVDRDGLTKSSPTAFTE